MRPSRSWRSQRPRRPSRRRRPWIFLILFENFSFFEKFRRFLDKLGFFLENLGFFLENLGFFGKISCSLHSLGHDSVERTYVEVTTMLCPHMMVP
jgi:hypothetical protein